MVLIVAKNRELVIYGDKGINELVDDDFWVQTKDKMISYFKNAQVCDGIILGVEDIAQKLSKYFPVSEKDTNEISNKVILENE